MKDMISTKLTLSSFFGVGISLLLGGCTVNGSHNTLEQKAGLQADFKPYKETIPGTEVAFEMVPIPGGKFRMGNESGGKKDEGPAHEVEISPFWMGKYEVTWEEYDLFVFPELAKEMWENPSLKGKIDGVSQPTPPFVDMSFGMGKKGFPAINMTHYAALSYCKWLTALTGDFYRLPTEAEWEYAARAGSTTAYSFGNDVDRLDEYAWYYDNSNGGYQQVGGKKPNAWGLYDMHGNVAEWTLDAYSPAYNTTRKTVKDPWNKPTRLYPHVVRGGSWDDDPEDLRSASRLASSPSWKQRDPQIPKSNWWMTDASFLGFRIVRPLEKPTQEEIDAYFADPIPDL